MNIHPDFEGLLRLLEEHGVDYMIVGGYAVAYHGYARFTKGIDVFLDPSGDTADLLWEREQRCHVLDGLVASSSHQEK